MVGGRDLEAGGTWLGVNQHGLVVALLNRRSASGPDPSRESRGLLCLRALQQNDLAGVEALLESEQGDRFNSFTLVAATRQRAVVAVQAGASIAIRPLPAGVHMVTNFEVNDAECPRIAGARQRFADVDVGGEEGQRLRHLREILSTHLDGAAAGMEDDSSLCIHRGPYGTRSSSLIALAAESTSYWHADGPPCRTGFCQVELPDNATTIV